MMWWRCCWWNQIKASLFHCLHWTFHTDWSHVLRIETKYLVLVGRAKTSCTPQWESKQETLICWSNLRLCNHWSSHSNFSSRDGVAYFKTTSHTELGRVSVKNHHKHDHAHLMIISSGTSSPSPYWYNRETPDVIHMKALFPTAYIVVSTHRTLYFKHRTIWGSTELKLCTILKHLAN